MDSSTRDAGSVPRHGGLHAASGPTLAAEVRATVLLFAMVVLVTVGFAFASTLALRLLAS